ncbi:MAG: IS200/IS605 family transposase [Deltaproteobacteria bacterium]|nr:IS200/IS605 family transposase [Deltaproteobacteria bacterium]
MGKNRVELHVHMVWSTAGRTPLIAKAFEGELFEVIRGRTAQLRCVPQAIGGMPDHVHLLARLHPSVSVSRLVGEVKGASSHFVNHRFAPSPPFEWQPGFGAFTVDLADVPAVANYVNDQPSRHVRGALSTTWEFAGED